jgi:ABC-type glycerol-3-phosphate transport system permease component
LLKILHFILSITVLSLAGYGFITDDFKFQPYMMLLLSLTMLVMGLREFQKENRGYGWLSVIAFVFIFFVSIQTFSLK